MDQNVYYRLGSVYYQNNGEMESFCRCPIIKITDKCIYIGYYWDNELKLNKGELIEQGETWHKGARRVFFSEERIMKEYFLGPFSDVPYRPELKQPEIVACAEQVEFALDMAKRWFAKNPGGTMSNCVFRLKIDHDIEITKNIRKAIKALGLAKTQNKRTPIPIERHKLLEEFVAVIQDIKSEGHIFFTDGPKYWRIVEEQNDRRIIYCFVRREDGAILQTRGWAGPALQTGVLGYLDDYSPSLLQDHGPSTEEGLKWRKKNNIPKMGKL